MNCCIWVRRLLLASWALCCIHCDGPQQNAGGTTESNAPLPSAGHSAAPHSGAQPALSAAGSAAATAATAPATNLAQKDVEQVFEHWLEAQNAGQFERYAALYAQRFTGIKRSGPRTSEMDRAGWLKDRSSMFKTKMRVEGKHPRFTLHPASASITFEQHWSSANYADQGNKRLILAQEGNTLRIAREEMLDSQVLHERPRAAADGLYLVVGALGKQFLLVGNGAKLIDPVLGKLKNTFVALGKADLSQAPEFGSWKGRALSVLDTAGKECEAVGGEVYGLIQALPHFGEQSRWEAEKVSEAQRAKEIEGYGSPYYAVEVVASQTGCESLVLGRDKSTPRPVVGRALRDAKLQELATEAFRKLPAYARLQKEYLAYLKDTEGADRPKQWVEYSSFGRSLQAFEIGPERQRYVWLSHLNGRGCGDFEGSLAMLFRVTGSKDAPQLTPVAEHYRAGHIDALLDIGADGQLEMRFTPTDSTLRVLLDSKGGILKDFASNVFDCGC